MCLALNLASVLSTETYPWELPTVDFCCCRIGTIEGGAEMIRDLFIAFVMLILTVTATVWVNSGPRLSVQQVEASLAR